MSLNRTALILAAGLAFAGAATVASSAPEPKAPDPKVMTFFAFDKIPWKDNAAAGNQSYIMFGDPDKPGWYGELLHWKPHHMSRPHFHPHDRFITVLKGTWWVGWGQHYDPDSTYPMHEGAVVTHIAGQTHYDGAKDEDAYLEIVGEGPATNTPNEIK